MPFLTPLVGSFYKKLTLCEFENKAKHSFPQNGAKRSFLENEAKFLENKAKQSEISLPSKNTCNFMGFKGTMPFIKINRIFTTNHFQSPRNLSWVKRVKLPVVKSSIANPRSENVKVA
ncbi:hypothetical protein CCY99_09155 [Helicobacter sp. 16-1353]|uniref:hypothetical protein n=1 Tax=Helicobacter sp. 16-1353 TaxID=2004996 RepID=UPI000DCCF16E|nr:hypothetical protein [Helicobacter sp. 16-1353]RAX51436.1 hypothetical protein CCY99_09155 [Helicobacter sp. 16-1353]